MRIRRTDLVLEIGSGDNPRPRSDVLCDNSIEVDAERGGRIVRDRPIVEADAQALPFRDAAFDYVICSHVLEHVEDPERMIRELTRVGRAGYIETPSEVGEMLYGWSFHRWVVRAERGKLVIRKKDFVSPFGEMFHVIGARDGRFREFHLAYGRLFLTRHEWAGTIDYEISTDAAVGVDWNDRAAMEALWARVAPSWRERWTSLAKQMVPAGFRAMAKATLARARKRPRRGIRDLRDLVACPACKGPVEWREASIDCVPCRVQYPIVDGIPRFLSKRT